MPERTTRPCPECGNAYAKTRGRGRWASACADCLPDLKRRKAVEASRLNPRGKKPDTPCSGCRTLLYSSPTSLPPDRILCRPCRAKRRAERQPPTVRSQEGICETCGGAFQSERKRRYCTNECRDRRPRGGAECVGCGVTFMRRGNTSQRYCSKRCSARRPINTSEIPWVSCLHCRGWFIARRGRRIHNSKCHYALTVVKHPDTTCETCGVPLAHRGPVAVRRFCSKTCQVKSPSGRANRGTARARRRARLKGATIETFDTYEVLERDSWICHICNKRTLRSKVVPHPRAPTLDHVIPLAQGGEHSRANTACACFDCNSRKGDRSLGPEQLRLMG